MYNSLSGLAALTAEQQQQDFCLCDDLELLSSQFLRNIPLPIAIAQLTNGRILYANTHLCELLSLTPQRLLASPTLDRYLDPSTWKTLQQDLFAGTIRPRYATKLQRCDRQSVRSWVSPQFIASDGKSLVLVIFQPAGDPILAKQTLEQGMRERTESQQTEKKLQLLQTLTQEIGEAQDLKAALAAALQSVCEAIDWPFGEAWVPNDAGDVLELSPAWYCQKRGDRASLSLARFRQQSHTSRFPAGVGLPGLAWSARQPIWFPDATLEPAFVRKAPIAACGLKAGFSVPIIAKDEVVAILVFFTFQACGRDRKAVELVSAVAAQLGTLVRCKQAEVALQESERRLASLMNATDGVFFIAAGDLERPIDYISEGCEVLTGYSSADFLEDRSLSLSEIAHPADLPEVLEQLDRCLARNNTYVVEYRIRTADRTEKWVWEKGRGVYDERGQITAIEGFITDITDRKCYEEALRQAEMKYRGIFENAIEGIFQTTPNGHYISANPALAKIYGYDSAAELMQSLTDIEHQLYVDPHQRTEFSRLMQVSESVTEFEAQVYRRDRSIIWISENARAIRDGEGNLLYYEGTVEDITERKQAKEALKARAFYDPLTELPNRSLFESRLKKALKRNQQEEREGVKNSYQFAVFFLDLDRFKAVNDRLGHLVGDRLLVAIARRLEGCLREGDTVARLGGDEFTILLEEIETIDEAIQIAERILEVLKAPFVFDGHQVFAGTSIGIVASNYCPHAPDRNPQFPTCLYESTETILRDADKALYRAKTLGKGRYQLFHAAIHQNSAALAQREDDLRQALQQQELEICYQPIISLKTGKLEGFEGLLRWRHPQHGSIPPHEFIPIAEETGLILPLGNWMLRETCLQLRRWQQLRQNLPPLMMHINWSSKQFLQPDLLEQIDRIVRETELENLNLRLEITESLWLKNSDLARTRLTQLRERNIQICIDDFGMGYSCLNDLQQFPIDALKIDRSFISKLDNCSEPGKIARTIVTLAHNLGMCAIAEGVETQHQLMLMRDFGCELAQGYFFAGALDARSAEELAKSDAPLIEWH